MAQNRNDIPLDRFTIQLSPPPSRYNAISIHIYEDGKFNLNGKLTRAMCGKRTEIRFVPDYMNICLLETGDQNTGIIIPRSGSCLLLDCAAMLKKRGLSFPVKYEMWYSEALQCWQGEYAGNPTRLSSGKHRSTKKN